MVSVGAEGHTEVGYVLSGVFLEGCCPDGGWVEAGFGEDVSQLWLVTFRLRLAADASMVSDGHGSVPR